MLAERIWSHEKKKENLCFGLMICAAQQLCFLHSLILIQNHNVSNCCPGCSGWRPVHCVNTTVSLVSRSDGYTDSGVCHTDTHVDTSTLVCTEGEQVRSAETSCEDRFTTKGLVSETNQWRKIMRRCSFSSRKNVFFLTDVHKAQNWERSKSREMEMIRESSHQEPVGKRTEK